MLDEYRKLFVSPVFQKDDFVDLLDSIGVEAASVDDGIILNYVQFEEVPAARLPHWVYLNRDDIRSKLHTRPASMRELRDAQGMADGIELLGVYATSAFGGWEFGWDGDDMYARCVYDGYVGVWEEIDDYDIANSDGTMIYHLRGNLDVLSSDILRVGA